MAYKKTGIADSLTAFLSIVDGQIALKRAPKRDVPVLFRGVRAESFSLVPKIGRPPLVQTPRKEKQIFEEFKFRAVSFLKAEPENDWEWLALAQHYGLSTRLLDWTENPLIALWFSVMEGTYHNPNEDYVPEHAAVYILPNLDVSRSEFVVRAQDASKIDPFKLKSLMFYRPRPFDDRILKQVGWFTAHPFDDHRKEYQTYGGLVTIRIGASKSNIPDDDVVKIQAILKLSAEEIREQGIELVYEEGDQEAPKPLKVQIHRDALLEIRKSLNGIGVNASTVFPDLGNLCTHLNWEQTSE
jgi:hypothetical protein